MAVVPLPANSVALASALDISSQKVSPAVTLSTLIALAYVPWVIHQFF